MKISKGTIIEFRGDPLTGIAMIVIKEASGNTEVIDIDFTDALSDFVIFFPEMVMPTFSTYSKFSVDFDKIVGKEVYYSLNDYGDLEGLAPVDRANLDIILSYGYYKNSHSTQKDEGQ